MTDTIRTFVAIQLPDDVRSALAALIKELSQSGLSGVKFVRPEGIHLTLKFLGNIETNRIEGIRKALTEAAGDSKNFDLRLAETGVFPGRSSARVLWVGLAGDLEQLSALHSRTDDALASMGFARDRRGLNPHLTIGRLRERASVVDRKRATDALLRSQVATGREIPVRKLDFVQSTLFPDGARYKCIASIPLSGESRNAAS